MKRSFRHCLLWILAILVCPLLLRESHAGDYDFDRYAFKTEVFATIGSGSWYSATSGLMMGGGVVLKPYPRAGFEITYRYLDAKQHYATTWHYRESGYTLTASVHYYFTQLRVQPYLLLGGGASSVKSISEDSSYDPPYRYSHRDSSFVLEAGGGVNFFVTRKFSIRPDVRLMIGDPGALHGGINLCYHW